MEECEEETLRNVTLWTADDNGNLQPPQAVGDTLCPSDCSGNGGCVNSTCVCNAGFLSVDCSIREGKLKQILKNITRVAIDLFRIIITFP